MIRAGLLVRFIITKSIKIFRAQSIIALRAKQPGPPPGGIEISRGLTQLLISNIIASSVVDSCCGSQRASLFFVRGPEKIYRRCVQQRTRVLGDEHKVKNKDDGQLAAAPG